MNLYKKNPKLWFSFMNFLGWRSCSDTITVNWETWQCSLPPPTQENLQKPRALIGTFSTGFVFDGSSDKNFPKIHTQKIKLDKIWMGD